MAIASEIRWKDEYGGIHFVRGMCVDKSRGGAGVVCNEPFASGTYLSLKFESGTTECVVVCHCQQMGAAYLLGLKFAVQGDR